jgi:hypothetical protein
MKRSRINPIGKIGRANYKARQMIAAIGEEHNIITCEIMLPGCLGTFGLAPAHRHKRDFYRGVAEYLADYNQWVGACQHCHELIERDKKLTAEVFDRLRPIS